MIDWIMQLFNKAAEERSETLIAKPLHLKGETRLPLEPDEHYISMRMRCLRIVYQRRASSVYYACVHSWTSLLDQRQKDLINLHVVTSPDELRKLDGQNVNRVIQKDILLLATTPYRGDLRLQIGLFSIKAADLIAPYLDLLQSLSSKASLGVLDTALAFAEPIKTGLNLLFGTNQETSLEVGLKQETFTESGTYVIARPSDSKVDLAKATLDENGVLVDKNLKPIEDMPYLVFTIDRLDKRADWFRIPEVTAAHEDLMSAIRDGNEIKARNEVMPHFRRVCITSPDLILKHALAIAEEQKKRLDSAFPGGQVSTEARAKKTWRLEDLEPFK